MKEKNTDTIVLDLLGKVKSKKTQIGKPEKYNWKTTCAFSFYEKDTSIDKINIQAVSDVGLLAKIYAFLKVQQDVFTGVIKELGLDGASFLWMGFSAEDWFSDIKARLKLLKINKDKKDLEALEARINSLVTPEQRREIELAAILNEFPNE